MYLFVAGAMQATVSRTIGRQELMHLVARSFYKQQTRQAIHTTDASVHTEATAHGDERQHESFCSRTK